jgi:uncharacterized protein with HEPN domain
MRSREADVQWLCDMLEFIDLLESSVAGLSKEHFFSMPPLWKWGIVKLIENIGESAYRLTPETKALSPDFPWGEVMGMRNRLVHGYDKINYITVYEVAMYELYPLREEINRLVILLQKEFEEEK